MQSALFPLQSLRNTPGTPLQSLQNTPLQPLQYGGSSRLVSSTNAFLSRWNGCKATFTSHIRADQDGSATEESSSERTRKGNAAKNERNDKQRLYENDHVKMCKLVLPNECLHMSPHNRATMQTMMRRVSKN
jgi:hypothetical protein